jgi:hypothetical protein
VVLDRLASHLYRKLGRRYKLLFTVTQVPAAMSIGAVAILLLTSYYRPSATKTLIVLGITLGMSTVAVLYALWRGQPYLARVVAWQENATPTAEESAAAWDAATNFPMRSFRANALVVSAIAAVPTVAAVTAVLGVNWTAGVVLLVGSLPAVGYANVLNYFIAELLMRPVIEDIAAKLPDDFPFGGV